MKQTLLHFLLILSFLLRIRRETIAMKANRENMIYLQLQMPIYASSSSTTNPRENG